MQKTTHKSNTKGFTIIEVLIVLAIAGLILLVVFLAVPALNRNSRNTSIKSDVQNVLGGVSEYRAANDGSNPTTIGTSSGLVTYGTSTGTGTSTSIKVQGSTVATHTAFVATAPDRATLAAGVVTVMLNAKCGATPAAAPIASNRSVAAYYTIETSSDTVLQCADS